MKRSTRIANLFVLLLAVGCRAEAPTTAQGPKPQSLPTVSLTLNGTPFTLQVADEPDERQTGLMYTRSMPADRGMIFIFPNERPLGFYMKNTPIDLDIIYADHTGRVVSVKTMRAYDITDVPSEAPATFAIELNAGTAAKLKIAAGHKLDLPSSLTAQVK